MKQLFMDYVVKVWLIQMMVKVNNFLAVVQSTFNCFQYAHLPYTFNFNEPTGIFNIALL